MFSRSLICVTILCSLLASGCQFISPGVKGSGNFVTANRQVSSFSSVHLYGDAEVTVTFGTTPSVSVTIDDNLQELISTEVNQDELVIRPTTSVSSTQRTTIEIVAVKLEGFHVSGSGKINIKDLQGEKLNLAIHGSSDVKVNGKVKNLDVSIGGSGELDLDKLEAEEAKISIAGSGDVNVNATKKLDVSIAGSGDVTYVGNPEVKKSMMGSGEVKQKKS